MLLPLPNPRSAISLPSSVMLPSPPTHLGRRLAAPHPLSFVIKQRSPSTASSSSTTPTARPSPPNPFLVQPRPPDTGADTCGLSLKGLFASLQVISGFIQRYDGMAARKATQGRRAPTSIPPAVIDVLRTVLARTEGKDFHEPALKDIWSRLSPTCSDMIDFDPMQAFDEAGRECLPTPSQPDSTLADMSSDFNHSTPILSTSHW